MDEDAAGRQCSALVRADVLWTRAAFATAFFQRATFAAEAFFFLADRAPTFLVGFRLTGGHRIDPGRRSLDRQSGDIDGRSGDRSDDAAGQSGDEKHGQEKAHVDTLA